MRGLFMAFGGEVAPGVALDIVRAVDVAPTVLALLGFDAPAWMEGVPIDLSASARPVSGTRHRADPQAKHEGRAQ